MSRSSGSNSALEAERHLQRAWFRAAGLEPAPDDRIHPGDEMFSWADKLGLAPLRRRTQYMRGGLEQLQLLRHLASLVGRPLGELGRVLEFASGHGRCTRMLVRDIAPERLWCSDIQADGVAFVRETFGVHGFVSRAEPELLEIDGTYDLIWVGSLFSHLPRERFQGFLARLYRALSPDGLLVFSTHGLGLASDESQQRDGFSFRPESESSVLDALEYGSSFVSPACVRAFAEGLGIEHVRSIEHDLWSLQDVHVATRKPRPELERWSNTPFVRGSIERAEVAANGHAWIGGWLRSPVALGAVERLRVVIDGELAHAAQVGNVRELILGEAARFVHAEWCLEGPTTGLAPGLHTLSAVATDAHGVEHCFDAAPLELA